MFFHIQKNIRTHAFLSLSLSFLLYPHSHFTPDAFYLSSWSLFSFLLLLSCVFLNGSLTSRPAIISRGLYYGLWSAPPASFGNRILCMQHFKGNSSNYQHRSLSLLSLFLLSLASKSLILSFKSSPISASMNNETLMIVSILLIHPINKATVAITNKTTCMYTLNVEWECCTHGSNLTRWRRMIIHLIVNNDCISI